MTQQLISHGLLLLFVLVAIESAGVPLPGETALVAASILVTKGHYELWEVIVVAALAAIIGDNIGYWIGRLGGRALLERWEPIARYARKALPPAERFFAKHGAKTVFLGRFIAFLRVTSAWLAGISHMPWRQFLLWNAAGGIAWATIVAVVSYEFGRAAGDAIGQYGLYGVAVVIGLALAAFVGIRLWRRRLEHG